MNELTYYILVAEEAAKLVARGATVDDAIPVAFGLIEPPVSIVDDEPSAREVERVRGLMRLAR